MKISSTILPMPELPEVEITKRKLEPLLVGQIIQRFYTQWPRSVRGTSVADMTRDIVGRKILRVIRRGKVLFFDLSGKPPKTMAVHLRMSGRLMVVPGTKPVNAWVRSYWELSKGRSFQFIDPRKFGIIWYGDEKSLQEESYLKTLGVDAKALSLQQFQNIVAGGRGMAKPFLLKQTHIAGIGNILADEALWYAGIHPQTLIQTISLPKVKKLYDGIQKTIRAMLVHGGTSLRNWGHPDGTEGQFQDFRKVYGRAGKACHRCRGLLARSVVGGRGTAFCGVCQQA